MAGQGECVVEQRSLAEWLRLLEVRHPCEIDLGLARIAKVAQALKLHRPAAQTISIAGTNGKGSAVAIMEAMLLRQGRRVGAYTSPHLLRYNERVRIDGQPVADSALCEAFVQIEAARGAISLSYFEFGTLAALLLFQQAGLDVALLEVGLGGRLDAVNIVDADVAIITSIALDHESWLGNSREQIALEKAGIARANKPLICADSDMPETLLSQLMTLGAQPYLLHSREFSYQQKGAGLTVSCTDTAGDLHVYTDLPLPHVPLPSALCAVQALLLIGELVVEEDVRQVFKETRLSGRLQQLSFQGKSIVLDVAHNPAAATLLADNFKHQQSGRSHALFAVMADKDIAGIVSPLCPLISHWHLAELPDISRAAKPEDVADILRGGELSTAKLSVYSDVKAALEGALQQMESADRLLGFGSFFTVAEILAQLEAELEPKGKNNG